MRKPPEAAGDEVKERAGEQIRGGTKHEMRMIKMRYSNITIY